MKKYILLFLANILLLITVMVVSKPFYSGATIVQFQPLVMSAQIAESDMVSCNSVTIDSLFYCFNHKNNLGNTNLIVHVTNKIIEYYPGKQVEHLQTFATILNEKNAVYKTHGNSSFTLDTLFYIYNWANQFKILSEISTGNASTFYKVIYDYWMTQIVQNLERISNDSNILTYSIKFKVLNSLCEVSKYSPNHFTPNTHKVLYNIENSNYNYILGRFYLIFGFFGIFSLILLLIVTLLSYYLFFNHLKKYFNNECN